MASIEKKTPDQESFDQIPAEQVKFNMEAYGNNPEELSEDEKAEYSKLVERADDLLLRYDRIWNWGRWLWHAENLPSLLVDRESNQYYSPIPVDMLRVRDGEKRYWLFLDEWKPILAVFENGRYDHIYLTKEQYKKVLKKIQDALDREEQDIEDLENAVIDNL